MKRPRTHGTAVGNELSGERSRSAAASRSAAGSRSRAPRTSSPRRWSRPCSARRRACCTTCPNISDVQVVRGLLEVHGVSVDDGVDEGELILDPSARRVGALRADIDAHAGSSRIPILFCGPLLHRLGEALIPDLGGCRIGDRPIDFHLEALREFGAIVDKSYRGHPHHGAERAARREDRRCPTRASARPSRCCSPRCTPKGITELRGAAIEPEIMDLIASCRRWARSSRYEHRPRHPHRGRRARSTATTTARIFDRNEAATWACAALATDGDIFVGGAKQPRCSRSSTSSARSAATFDDPGGRHPLLHRGGRAQAGRRRDRRAPRVHDRLAAAARRGAHPGQGRLDRARDRVREPASASPRRSSRWARHRRAPGVPRQPAPAAFGAAQLPALRRDHRARPRCTAPTSRSPTSAAASATSSRRSTAEGESTVSQRRHHPPRLREPHHEARAPRRRLRRHRIMRECRTTTRPRTTA